MKRLILMGLVLLLAVPCFAAGEETEKAATNIERFLSKKGHMSIKSFYPVGEMSETGNATFEVVVIADPGGKLPAIKGMRIEVTQAGRIERSNTAFVDAEELDSLSKALGYMLNLSANWTTDKLKTETEANFKTNGDLTVGIFTSRKGEQQMIIKAGVIGQTMMFGNVDSLKEVKTHIDAAIALLKTK